MARELTRKAAVARKAQNELDPAYLADPRIALNTGLRHAVAKLKRLRESERSAFVNLMRARIVEAAAKMVKSDQAATLLACMNACVQAIKYEHQAEARALAVIPSLAEAAASIEAHDVTSAMYLRNKEAAAGPRTLAERMLAYKSRSDGESAIVRAGAAS